MASNIIVCPRCDGQGHIFKKLIKFNKEMIYICDECDAIWFNDEKIQSGNFIDYSTYMESLSRKGLWSELGEE